MKFKRVLALSAWIAAIVMILVSCDSELDVKQAYGLDLVTMPVQKSIAEGGTAEIRCALTSEGDYAETRYTIRYFQGDGKGELRLDDGTLLSPNDRYPLERTQFRLYYTSRCAVQQILDIYIEDTFGQVVKKTFSWQNEKADDPEPADGEWSGDNVTTDPRK